MFQQAGRCPSFRACSGAGLTASPEAIMSALLRSTLLLSTLALVLAACDSPTGPGPATPARVAATGGDLQTAVAGAELPQPLVASARDARGRPVRGQLLDFRVVAGAGFLTAGGANTDANGDARVRWVLGPSTADTQRVEVRALDATGAAVAADTFRAVAQPDQPATLEPIGGAARVGAYGAPLADSLAVVLRDRWGNPVPGVPVAWTVTAGGGSVSPAVSSTNGVGVATASWTPGLSPGEAQRMEAAAGVAIRTVFTANDGLIPGLTVQKAGGDAQAAAVGTVLADSLVVQVRAAGVPVPGVQVVWAPAPGMGSASPAVSLTDAQGRAAAAWTLGTRAGPQPLTALVQGADPAIFSAAGTPAAAARLEAVQGDSAAAPRGAQVELAVRALDAYGNRVGAGTLVSWSTSTGGSFSPPASVTGADGIARTTWTPGSDTTQRALAFVGGGPGRPEVWLTLRLSQGWPHQVVILPVAISFTAPGQTAALRVYAYDARGEPAGEVAAAVTSLDPSVAAVSASTAPATVTAAGAGATRVVATWGPGADTIDVVVRVTAAVPPVAHWSRELGSPTTRRLSGVWASSAFNAYVVGAEGYVHHWDGARWTTAPRLTTRALHDVWGAPGGEVFAVGEGGTLLRRAGGTWARMASPVQATLYGVWGASATDVWAAGDESTILHFDGSAWSVVSHDTAWWSSDYESYGAVWGVDDMVFAVGRNIHRFDGTAWRTQLPGDPQLGLTGVWGTAANLVYALTYSGALLRYDGTVWTRVHSPDDAEPYPHPRGNALGGTGPRSVFAAIGGQLRRWDGAAFQSAGSLVADSAVTDVWGVDASTAFAVSAAGDAWRWDGARWTLLSGVQGGGKTLFLDQVWTADGVTAYAVGTQWTGSGAEYVMVRRTAAGWRRITPPAAGRLRLSGVSPSHLWVAGAGGIFQWDGGAWTRIHDRGGELFAVAPDQVYASTVDGVQRWDGTAWTTVGPYAGVLWASGPADVWVARWDTVRHYDGSRWTQTILRGTPPVYPGGTRISAIFGTGPGDVYVVGEHVFHWNGTAWSQVGVQERMTGTGVWASSPRDVYVVGREGTVWHWDGMSWHRDAAGEAGGTWLTAVHGAAGHVFAVGLEYTVLHGSP
jgi:hypothetical protein